MLRYCCKVMKADINHQNCNGFTPFHYVCMNKGSNGFNMKILRYYCEVMKADINVMNNLEYTPFDYLYELKIKNNHNILKYLGKHNLLTNKTIKKQ